MFVAGIADAIAALFGNGVGAIAMQDVEIKLAMLRQMPHAGDEACSSEPSSAHFANTL